MSIFPFAYAHAGGDEVPKREWRESASAQRRRVEYGIADEEELQGWFTAQIDRMLRGKGRRLVAWDEVIVGGAPKDTVVMAWRSSSVGVNAALRGYDVVMSPSEYLYLDHRQSTNPDEPVTSPNSPLPLARVFEFEPVPEGLREAYGSPGCGRVLGGQIHLWSEYVPTIPHAEYMAFPRLCAFAEAVWREPLPAGGTRSFPEFHRRLSHHALRLQAAGIRYRRFDNSSAFLELEQVPPNRRLALAGPS